MSMKPFSLVLRFSDYPETVIGDYHVFLYISDAGGLLSEMMILGACCVDFGESLIVISYFAVEAVLSEIEKWRLFALGF